MSKSIRKKYVFIVRNLLGFLLTLLCSYAFSQTSCYDIDFENGTLNGWTTSGNVSIVSTGTDIYGGFPVSAPGGNYSVKVGNNTDPTPSSLSKSFVVTSNSPILTYRYAMDLLNYPHTSTDAGRVIIDVLDQNNNTISCAHYEALYSTNGGGPQGFLISSQAPEGNIGGECCYPISYKPWTSLSIDLTPYIGQSVTLRASCEWCIYDVDWAYAYFDFNCTDYQLTQDTTCNGIGALLVAPPGFEGYSWTGPGVVTGQTNDSTYVNQPGLYTVNMLSATGCTISKSLNVTYVPPVVTATASANTGVCKGDSVTLTSSGGGTYRWLNTFVTSASLTVAPSSTTSYTVEVTDQFGCKDSASTTVEIYPLPTAFYSSSGVCKGDAMDFTNMSSIITGSITDWAWSFGDNTAWIYTENATHTYTDTGTFSTTLIVTSNNSCKDTIVLDNTVHPLPVPYFTAGSVCEGSITFFTDASTCPAPDGVQIWAWHFGDGSPIKNNPNTSHLYPAAGSYTAKLVVTSDFGCQDSITRSIVINPNPVSHFSAADTTGCSPLCVSFQNESTISSGANASFVWNYGAGGNTDNAINGYNCYTNNTGEAGMPELYTFDVSLTVTSDSGCVSSYTKNDYITVFPNPVANFTADPLSVSILNPGIEFTNLSLSETEWEWDFGDLTTSLDENPELHLYPDTGIYTIQLIVTNPYSCSDTTYRTITIEPDWAFFVPNAFTPNSDGVNDSFQGYGYGLLDYNMSIFDRWGNHIYQTESYDKPWDGKANSGNDKAQMDVYIYQISIEDIHGKKHTYTGTVTLVR
jgi:gliding motility-associated-like protein